MYRHLRRLLKEAWEVRIELLNIFSYILSIFFLGLHLLGYIPLFYLMYHSGEYCIIINPEKQAAHALLKKIDGFYFSAIILVFYSSKLWLRWVREKLGIDFIHLNFLSKYIVICLRISLSFCGIYGLYLLSYFFYTGEDILEKGIFIITKT